MDGQGTIPGVVYDFGQKFLGSGMEADAREPNPNTGAHANDPENPIPLN